MLNCTKILAMTGRQLISKFLIGQGVKKVFCLPGIHAIPLINSFISHGISIYMARCERSLLFMADGYSRASGRIAVAIITPGPGLANSLIGCMEAFWSEIPLLLIHIDIGSGDKGKGVLHELMEPEKMFEYVTKKRIRVEDERDLCWALQESFVFTKDGRPGPVLLSIPFKLLEKETGLSCQCSWEGKKTFEIQEFSENLIKLLHSKVKPVIVAGWQMMTEEARDLFDEICSYAGIPFLTTTGGKGIVDERRPYAFGNVIQKGTVSKLLKEADLVIAMGTRLRDVDTKRRGVRINELVHVDVDECWFDKNYKAELKGVGNPKVFLEEMKDILKAPKFHWDIYELKDSHTKEIENLKNNLGFRIIKTIRESIPEETVTVWDLNILSYWAEYYFPVYKQRTFFMPRGSSTIFYGLPAAIGAKIASMNLPCLSICGDGGVLPSIGELATIAKYRIPVVLLIYNNSSFGVLERVMSKRYEILGSMTLENPDFVKIAEAFGFKGKKARNEEELCRILKKEVTWDEPFVIELSLPVLDSPWEV